jgi:predicted RNA-binding Zn-ribbon protein involved in translation (DUF1610 family)
MSGFALACGLAAGLIGFLELIYRPWSERYETPGETTTPRPHFGSQWGQRIAAAARRVMHPTCPACGAEMFSTTHPFEHATITECPDCDYFIITRSNHPRRHRSWPSTNPTVRTSR